MGTIVKLKAVPGMVCVYVLKLSAAFCADTKNDALPKQNNKSIFFNLFVFKDIQDRKDA